MFWTADVKCFIFADDKTSTNLRDANMAESTKINVVHLPPHLILIRHSFHNRVEFIKQTHYYSHCIFFTVSNSRITQ